MKSHVSVTLLDLAVCLLKDAAAKCAVHQPDLDRDVQAVRSRVEHEGISFLTLTLPDFGKAFERSLASGQLDTRDFTAFKKVKKRGLPAFLRGYLCQVFDAGTGRILNDSNPDAIEAIRQIAYAFKKLALRCTPKRVQRAIEEFKECEYAFETPLSQEDIAYFCSVSSVLWDSTIPRETDFISEIVPKHGPGATAERVSGNQKYRPRRWHERLEPYFPLDGNLVVNSTALLEGEAKYATLVNEDQEQPVRVTPVPKTLKGPRIIAIEPVCMQYAQQGISKYLIRVLERSRLTSGHLNFRDQKVNQRLAVESSRSGDLATLDLSSASDRVPRELALRMFDSNPDLRDAIDACRSMRAELPSGEVIPLKKFASMGSALCFPVEAMYFYTICVGSLLREHNLPVTWRNIFSVSRNVYVYGDDIIVPSTSAAAVIADLQKYYCKVGSAKSFWTGKFRESCGADAYDGVVVTPTYIRKMHPNDRQDVEQLISWTKTSNQFYLRGYWLTSTFMIKKVESILGELPIIGPNAPCLGKVSFQRGWTIRKPRWNPTLQRLEVKGWVTKPRKEEDVIDGYTALLKSLLILSYGGLESVDEKHLLESVRHGTSTLKRRWTVPY